MTAYDTAAEGWVRRHYEGSNPDAGSVKFTNDCSAYSSGGWADVDVAWTEDGFPVSHTIDNEAWRFDWTEIIRELTDPPQDDQPPALVRWRVGLQFHDKNGCPLGGVGFDSTITETQLPVPALPAPAVSVSISDLWTDGMDEGVRLPLRAGEIPAGD